MYEEDGMANRNEHKMTFVIVDDDPTYLKVWEKVMIGLTDCQYMLTNDPQTAISLLKKNNVDVLISDIVMPKVSGYELVRVAHQHRPSTKVVLTTGYDCDLSHFDLKDTRFHVLYKPYKNISDIMKFVKHLINKGSLDDLDEDSFSENTYYPSVMEWKL